MIFYEVSPTYYFLSLFTVWPIKDDDNTLFLLWLANKFTVSSWVIIYSAQKVQDICFYVSDLLTKLWYCTSSWITNMPSEDYTRILLYLTRVIILPSFTWSICFPSDNPVTVAIICTLYSCNRLNLSQYYSEQS